MLHKAVFSDCGKYRYTLERIWSVSQSHMLIIMLNPSTANAEVNDQTTRKCVNFARKIECGSYCAVNLFALQTKSPKIMMNNKQPVGLRNDRHLKSRLRELNHKDYLVVAWGVHGLHLSRDQAILSMISIETKLKPMCFGHTKHGMPMHPTYIKLNELIPFKGT